jgi:lysozyme
VLPVMKHLAPIALLLATVAGCAPAPAPPSPRLAAEEEALRQQCPGREKVRGIDVSYYQGRVDWPAVRAHGVAFAFARVADGAGFVDPAFGENWAGMKAAGVIRGSYQFFRPAEDPIAQAAVLVREIQARGGLQPGDLPPALDIEVSDGVAAATLRGRAQAWLTQVEAGLGRTPMVYTSPGFWEELEAGGAFGRYTLWLAHWDTACPSVPGAWDRWRFWQDGTDRTVPGVAEPVDSDWFDGTRAELLAFAGAPEPRRGGSPKAAPRARAPGRPRSRHAPARAPRVVDLARLLRMLTL